MIRTETMKDGNKAKIVIDVDGEVIYQPITHIGDGLVWVKSSKDNEYPVNLSDRVAMTIPFNVGDTAVIKTFRTGWLVTDILPAEPEEEVDEFTGLYRKKINGSLTDEELVRFEWLKKNDMDLQNELKEFEDLLGGY